MDTKLETISKCDICGNSHLKKINRIGNACKCLKCGYIFISPRPTQKDIIKFYSRESQYNDWLEELEGRNKMWDRRLKLILPYKTKGDLLDMGTGIGQFLSVARKYFKVYGTEPSIEGRQLAKKHFNLTIEENIKFGMKFDVVTLFHVLEHVPSPSVTIKLCQKLLKREGILVIAVPNSNLIKNNSSPLDDIFKRLVNKPGARFPKIQFEKGGEIHLSYFKSNVLKKLLNINGFEIINDTADPYKPQMSMTDQIEYKICKIIKKYFNINLYDTILIIAIKK